MNSKQFIIIFKGELLTAYDVAEVQKSLVQQFNIDATELEQLFSGATVVLKKNMTVEQATIYHEKCQSLGLITYIKNEPILGSETDKKSTDSKTPESIPQTSTTTPYTPLKTIDNVINAPLLEVIFKGELLAGFNVTEVKKSLNQRFNFDATKLEWLFSGATVVLKKNMNTEQAISYCHELKSLGLITYTEESQLADVADVVKAPPIWGLDCSGRYGRLNFINAIWIIFLIYHGINLVLKNYLEPSSNQPVLGLVISIHVLAIILQLFCLRIIILRLHDLNLSAWWVLLFIPSITYMFALMQILLIPNQNFYYSILLSQWVRLLLIYIMVSTILLMIIPGTNGKNKYGLPVRQGNLLVFYIALFLYLLPCLFILYLAYSFYKVG